MHKVSTEYSNPLFVKDVEITDSFWNPRIDMNREQTIPFQYQKLKDTGRIFALTLSH